MMEYEMECQNEECRKVFITIRPKTKYCCQSCAGVASQAQSKTQPKDHDYLQWLAVSKSHIKYLSMPWTKRGLK